MDVKIEESWKQQLQDEFDKPYFKQLTDFVRSEYASQTVYPPAKLIFNAFNQCPFDRVKVVILGQDPYHGPGQAHVSGEKLITSVSVGHRLKPPTRFSKGKIAKNRIAWFYFDGVAEKGYWYRAD